jgi:WD40 repeat protein/tetratricopeptide (TPR) repeat protein
MMELQADEVNTKNQDSLRTLSRAITLSQGFFSLILARCNYQSLQQHLMQQLRERSSVEFKEIVLNPLTKTLYTTIRAALGDEQPSAVIVSGLDLVSHLEAVLVATNHARDEFRKHFSFPLVLWVTDEVLQKFIRVAPDFTSWAATPIGFTIATTDLIESLHQSAESVFTAILNTGSGKFLDNTDLNLEIGSRRRLELEAALKDLQHRGEVINPELEADLQFLLGLEADNKGHMGESRQYYEKSLAFWQQQLRDQGAQEAASGNPKSFERVGCLLFYLGLWWRRYAIQHRSEYSFACSHAKNYFQECIDVFEQNNRPDLMAKFINPLGEVLQKLKAWDELESIAKLAVRLHQIYFNPIRLAYGYGLLAELALSQKAWKIAKQFAKLALQTNAKSSKSSCDVSVQGIDRSWSQHHNQNLYLLLLAQAQKHLGNIKQAIKLLEIAKTKSHPQHDPSLYIRIVRELRSLYFNQGRYREAFWMKQERSSVEYQYGFRAFIGAGQLQPRCQVTNPTIAPVDQQNAIAQEIAASGRQQDINRLIERISRTDYKLTVIHGPSGVGKSSLVTAGLVPALQQRAIGDRDALPIVLRGYTNWVNDLGQSVLKDLGTSLSDALSELRDLNLPLPQDYPAFILNQLRKNGDRNLITVLIFDQIEEFFFVYTDSSRRCLLYNFLRDCLDIPYVKVILSLREDYLHYLLECERCTNLDIINNNILDKKIRYYLGNFSTEDAKTVIHNLNERSQFYLDSALIDKLVQDLAENTGEVRPIELQVIGAQLHAEAIVTLEEYQRLGSNPKQELVERFLQETIKDCGPPNARIALQVLYLLTDENGTRPPKTRAELTVGLENSEFLVQDEQLDLVLEILTESGLLMLWPDAPADRYQLVHDYLVSFIRQLQQVTEGDAALERERRQRKLTEQQLNRVLRQRLLVGVAGMVVTLLALSAIRFALIADFQRKQTEIAEIEALSSLSSALLLSDDQLGALVESVKVGKRLKTLQQDLKTSLFGSRMISSDIRLRSVGSLQQSVYQIQERNRLEKHNGAVNSVSFSPDGKRIASASADKTIKLWSLDGNPPQSLTGHSGIVNSVSFSPDGQFIASASDNTVKLWKVDGTLLRSFEGHSDRVNSVSFSPDSKTMVSASDDKTVKLWSVEGRLLKTWAGHGDRVNSVSFSPDAKTIVSASNDKTIKFWSVEGTLVRTLSGHRDWVNSVTFSPDGQTLASASADNTIKLWTIDGKLRQTLIGHTDKVNTVRFSPNGQAIASGSTDQSVKVWSLDGKLLQTFSGHANWVNSVSFSPDGQTLASASADNTIKLWSLSRTPLPTLAGHQDIVTSVSISPDGQLITSASADKTIKLWSTDGRLRQTLTGHDGVVNSVSFSPDGQMIASASADKTIKLWSTDGQLLHTLTGHTDWVNNVSFSPDGQMIASASADKTIKLWSTDGQLLHTLTGHTDWVNSVSFSPDDQMLVSASNDMTVKLWRKDGTFLKTLTSTDGHTSSVNDVSFSPDGKIVASASSDNRIILWNLNGSSPIILDGHLGRVTSVRFHPDGKTIVSASADKTLKFWSLDGNLLRTLESNRSSINSVSVSPDGKTLVSATDEKVVILWNFDLDDLLVRGCEWLNDYLNNRNANIKPEENGGICDEPNS